MTRPRADPKELVHLSSEEYCRHTQNFLHTYYRIELHLDRDQADDRLLGGCFGIR